MIVIDMDMPNCCGDCYVGFTKQIGCDKHIGFENYDTVRHPDCPIKCDIEDIKTEIAEYKDDKVIHAERNEMIDIVLEIIDRHCGKEQE